MDETNLEILRLLQGNGRMTTNELAQRVGRSESTVRERVASLEMGGFLQGYQARVDWSRVGLPATAVIRARCNLDKVQEVAKQLGGMPNVTRALLLTGPWPVMAMVRVRDIAHLHSLLRDSLSHGHLTDVEAELALDSLVEQRPPTLLGNGLSPAAAPLQQASSPDPGALRDLPGPGR